MSAREIDAVITTAASAGCGRFRNSPGKNTSMRRISTAPVTPVSCDFEPERSATAVRDPLVLTGKPWKRPAARFAAPIPIISWLPRISCPVRAANAVDVEIVSVKDTSAIPRAPANISPRSAKSTWGMVNGGNPRGSSPTSETPFAARSKTAVAAIAATTMTSTAGTLGSHRCRTSISTIPPMPTAAAATTVSPLATPSTNPTRSPMKFSLSILNPKSFGSWPTRMVIARPFM
ncbi:hypothetical protein SRABI128_06471 [Microbacterium sp. Bi128]|nr:hypothetical protein SRABI128_06471 [Microbacterium sp. Bi128]